MYERRYQTSPPQSHRYVLEAEQPPAPKPRHWRGLWLIRDLATSDRAVREKFWHWGAADLRTRCLNDLAPAVLCGNSAPDVSYAERLALAS